MCTPNTCFFSELAPQLQFDVLLTPKPKSSWLASKYGVVFFTFIVTVGFVSIWSHQVWQGRENALITAEATATNLARAIEDANSRTMQAVDLILTNVGAGLRPNGWLDGRNSQMFLQSLLDEAPQVREIAFADASGRIQSISRRILPADLNIAGEDFFQRAREGTLTPFYLSTHQPGRLLGANTDTPESVHHWHILAIRTVENDFGEFQGVALAVLNPGYFQEQIGALDLGPGGFATFYRYDGSVLVQSGQNMLEVGTEDHSDSALFVNHVPKREWGTYRQAAVGPGDYPHIISYRATTRWPVLVSVDLHQDDALATWRSEAATFSFVMGGGLVALLILSFVVYRQRSAQDRAEHQLTLLGTALKTSANMVLITDVDAKIVWVNDAFCQQFGYTFKEVIGQNPRILSSGLMTPSIYKELWETILGGKIWTGEFVNRCKDGRLLIVNQTISPIINADGETTHFVGIHDDITKRKEAENDLREAKIVAETANTVKTQFLANMSHELRTPLNAVLGFIDMMRMQTFGPLGHEKYREYTDDIHTSASHLLTLISDILDVSKIEAGKMEMTEDCIRLEDLAQSCTKLMLPRAKEHDVVLTTHIEPNVPGLLADEVRIKQVVLNLLTNAIKFTPAKGQIRLVMELGTHDGIVIRCEDTGVGIAPDEIRKVLEPFGQAGEKNRLARDGVGLGLYLVKTITEMHDGRVDLTSEVGVGTNVSIILPPSRSCNLSPIIEDE